MKNNTKNTNDKVISKNTKGTRKKLSKQKNIFERFVSLIKDNKTLSIIIISLFIVVLIGVIVSNNITIDPKVITINGSDYDKSDYMIHLYSAKLNYFGEIENISKDNYNVIYDEETNMTVGDYLKQVALTDLKTLAGIKVLADNYSVELTNEDLEEFEKEKGEFIEYLGGNKSFEKFLKDNNTTENAYDNMSKTEKLYNRIIKKIYSEGSINDLTEEEYNNAKSNYYNEYLKIKQIILTTIDIETGKSLSSTAINQKETLAKNIVEQTRKGVDFDTLIKKYSEDATDKEEPYDLYYRSGELLSELESEVLKLNVGEVSEPIRTKYAYHIIERQELDDSKLDIYYDELREEKCINDLKEYIEDLKIIYHDAYEKIKVK